LILAVKKVLINNFIHGGGGAPIPPAGEEASPDRCNGVIKGGGLTTRVCSPFAVCGLVEPSVFSIQVTDFY